MTDAINQADPTPDPIPDPAPEAAARTRWRDRVLGFRGVLAVALAGLIVGGVGGAAIGALASGDDDHDRRGPGPMELRGDRPERGEPGGFPGGGLPPGTPPQDEAQPDDSGDTNS
jgi:hypothetical protein